MAAVLVPNVLKYVNQASKAGVKQDAASVLTQVQADLASEVAFSSDSALSDNDVNGMSIASGSVTLSSYTVGNQAITAASYSAQSATGGTKFCNVTFEYVNKEYQVTGLTYDNGAHVINWTSTGGWTAVDSAD